MVLSLKDRYGVPYWLVCDPQADRPMEARTDNEVRQILEQRYRQSALPK